MTTTPTRAQYFVVCALVVVALGGTSGCVRELTDLTVGLLPLTPDAAPGEISRSDTAGSDAATLDAQTPDAWVSLTSFRDAGVAPDAALVSDEAERVRDAGLLPVDAAEVAVADKRDAALHVEMDAQGAAHPDAGSAAAVDAGVGSRAWVFAVATAFQHDDEAALTIPMLPAANVTIDGDNSEWSDQGWVSIATPDSSIGEPESAQDLSAVAAFRWDAARLYMIVVVMDELHVNEAAGFDIWGGDSVQVAFDVGHGGAPYDWEYGFATTSHGLIAHRWREGDADLSEEMAFAVRRYAGLTVYELAFEPQHLGVNEFPTEVLRLSLAVNDNDGTQRSAALELVQGIVGYKSAARFASAEWRGAR